MKNWYKNLEDRFPALEKETQVLHTVSDLLKAKKLREVNAESAKNHTLRAIILLDYIIADPKWDAKLRELLRLREVIASLFVGTQPLGTIDQVITAALLLDRNAYRMFRK